MYDIFYLKKKLIVIIIYTNYVKTQITNFFCNLIFRSFPSLSIKLFYLKYVSIVLYNFSFLKEK